MKKLIGSIIIKSGYEEVNVSESFLKVFIGQGGNAGKKVIIFDMTVEEMHVDKYVKMQEQIIKCCTEQGYKDKNCLNIIIAENSKKAYDLGYSSKLLYEDRKEEYIIIDLESNSVICGENFSKEYKKEKENIERILSAVENEDDKYIDKIKKSKVLNEGKKKPLSKKRNKLVIDSEYKWYLKMSTVHLCIINVIIFLYTDIFAYLKAIEWGACGWDVVVNNGQWYRLLSSMFLHGDISHVVGNMTSLIFVGMFLEEKIGRKMYLLVYFSSGIIAGFTSISYNMLIGESYSCSIGASGAIFGILGGFIAYGLIYNQLNIKKLALFVLLMFLMSPGENIDNAAHVGGFIFGIAITTVICYVIPRIKKAKS